MSPTFLTLLSTHTTLSSGPRQTLGKLTKKRFLCGGFWCVNAIAICMSAHTGLYQALGSAVSPAVSVVPCVRFNCFVRFTPPPQLQHSV